MTTTYIVLLALIVVSLTICAISCIQAPVLEDEDENDAQWSISRKETVDRRRLISGEKGRYHLIKPKDSDTFGGIVYKNTNSQKEFTKAGKLNPAMS